MKKFLLNPLLLCSLGVANIDMAIANVGQYVEQYATKTIGNGDAIDIAIAVASDEIKRRVETRTKPAVEKYEENGLEKIKINALGNINIDMAIKNFEESFESGRLSSTALSFSNFDENYDCNSKEGLRYCLLKELSTLNDEIEIKTSIDIDSIVAIIIELIDINGFAYDFGGHKDGDTFYLYDIYYTDMWRIVNYLKNNNLANKLSNEDWQSLEEAKRVARNIESRAGGSDYQKAKLAHDYLIERADYFEGIYKADEDGVPAGTYREAYSALIKGSTVCQGYANAFEVLMKIMGVESVYMAGVAKGESSDGSEGGHAWNAVKTEAGWMQVDVTWDDMGGAKKSYMYFGLRDIDMDASRKWIKAAYNPANNIANLYYTTGIYQDGQGEINEHICEMVNRGKSVETFVLNADASIDRYMNYLENCDVNGNFSGSLNGSRANGFFLNIFRM